MSTLTVCLGDSLTYGYPYGPAASWVQATAEQSGQRLVNAGQNGATGPELINGFARHVLAHQPDYVIIGTGTNEALRRECPSSYEKSIETLQALATRHGIVPILIVPIPLLTPEEETLGKLRELIRQQPCATLDFYQPFLEASTGKPDGRWYSDLVHPNRRGYRRLAQATLTHRFWS